LDTGRLATRVDRMQRDHGSGLVGLSHAQNRVADPERLYKRGGRCSRRCGPNAARPERVHATSVPRHRRRSWLLFVQAVQQSGRAQAAVVLGTYQPRHCKHR